MLKDIEYIKKRKSHNQELRSLQYLAYHENILIIFLQKRFENMFGFEHQNHLIVFKVLF